MPYLDKILDTKYDKLDIKEMILRQDHLDANQRQGFETLFKNVKNIWWNIGSVPQ